MNATSPLFCEHSRIFSLSNYSAKLCKHIKYVPTILVTGQTRKVTGTGIVACDVVKYLPC